MCKGYIKIIIITERVIIIRKQIVPNNLENDTYLVSISITKIVIKILIKNNEYCVIIMRKHLQSFIQIIKV